MRLTVDQFRDWEHKSITLMGMSGVGKTRLAALLRSNDWFHYSADYRIGTRYLDEAILDNIKRQAMKVPFLRELLRKDSIYIANNITVDNLQPVSTFLGKLGNPDKGGLNLDEFKHRQELHRLAEIAALRDVPTFIKKAHDIYGYKHFINDVGGSVCEIGDEDTLKLISEHTLVIYIKATQVDEKELIQRAEADPKPLYYNPQFLEEQLSIYMKENQHEFVAMIDPDDFVRWVFIKLFHSRMPKYDNISAQYGYTISTEDLWKVQTKEDFLTLIEQALHKNV